jgi:hypothetical protein
MNNYRTSAITSAIAASVPATQSTGADLDNLRAVLHGLRSRVRPLHFVSLGVTILFAIGCTLWAIHEGVSLPLALMGGYCTIIAGIALFVAQLVLTHLTARDVPAQASRKPNYAAWKLVSTLNVSNASRLWCDIEPGHPYSQESMAWAAAMLDAIKSGALPISPKPHATKEMIAREQANPGWNTEVTRDALRSWALQHGHCPTFLRQ